jgi:uncharacterized membrane protein (GlpM family)
VALVAVGVVVSVAHLVGPGAAGLVSAFPTFSTALAVLVARDRGATGVAAVLTGTVRALPAYLVFCVTVWLAAPVMGIGAAVALGLTACLATSRIVLPGAGPSRSARPRFDSVHRRSGRDVAPAAAVRSDRSGSGRSSPVPARRLGSPAQDWGARSPAANW